MALNPIKDRDKSAANITDIVDIAGSATTLETNSEASPDHVFRAVDTSTGNHYRGYNGDVRQGKDALTLHYDFATDGGTIGTINLRGGKLPNNAIVTNAWYEVTTTFTTAGSDAGTIALGIATDDATGIEGATAVSAMGDIWDAGIHGTDLDPSTTTTFTTKTTAERNVIMTIATQNVTAGALVLHLEFSVSEIDTSS